MERLILGGGNYESISRGGFYVPQWAMWVCLQRQTLSELCELFHFPGLGNGYFATQASNRNVQRGLSRSRIQRGLNESDDSSCDCDPALYVAVAQLQGRIPHWNDDYFYRLCDCQYRADC